ncbi:MULTISPECIES: helix-turn-helix domain-containing protein [Modicisalibacter]|uniref:helix-turn-helix domain-containing protein n=1 Tax=Modicisalibacter TaxID=574347 RepID=UPI00100AC4E0|nr:MULTISPECIES: helix-turn-helix domain-containing protein [Halomonadaceae]MBZ9557488.1 helix-turn-helix domain-containing protein [Modicisalibacter sp. R2A 31.J]MBZ9573846.1 helix-turn-helix domain-containing protein [Modicisalibacter sp. MOD 31.J]
MTVAFHHCEDVTEHALRLNGWQQEYNQIEAGRFSGDIIDIDEHGIRLFRESANLGLSHSMHFPEAQWHLVLPIHWPNDSLFDLGTVTVLPRCEEFWSVTRSNYDLLVVSIDRNRYAWLGRDERRLRKLDVPGALLAGVREQWRAMTDYLLASLQHGTLPAWQSVFSRQLEEGVDLLLSECSRSPYVDDVRYRTRRYIVDRCHAMIRAQPDDPPSMMALCRQLKISRRTLQYSFQVETGQSPVHYLRALRLNAARRSLFEDPTQPIADAAARQGFFHQSYFSREYRRLFKESPSATLKRLQAS